jgi:hypothetical protein
MDLPHTHIHRLVPTPIMLAETAVSVPVGVYKLLVFVFVIVPWTALKIVAA